MSFNELFECLVEGKGVYVGNCKTIVDPKDTEAVTQLEQDVKNAKKITKEEFVNNNSLSFETLEKLDGNPDNFTFGHILKVNVYFYYDIDDDVEYFYAD